MQLKLYYGGLTMLNLIFKSENISLTYGILLCLFINANVDILDMLLNLNIFSDESIWLNIIIRSIIASVLIYIIGEYSYQWFKAKLVSHLSIKN